jgi:nucleotide-binding universal stress UspA family protein
MSEASIKTWRILLPLDVSRDSLSALSTAFDLAAALGGEVTGLFIEDSRLLAAGSLPFAREVGSMSGRSQPIGSSDIEKRFHALADKARGALGEAAQRLRVRFSFKVARGDVPAEILTATTDADMVVLGKAGWSLGAFRRPGSTCLAILSGSPVPVLVVEQGERLAAPILVIDDGTPAGRRAVEFAQELSRRLGWGIATASVAGAAAAGELLDNIRRHRPRLVVLPSSLPSKECASQFRNAVLVVP